MPPRRFFKQMFWSKVTTIVITLGLLFGVIIQRAIQTPSYVSLLSLGDTRSNVQLKDISDKMDKVSDQVADVSARMTSVEYKVCMLDKTRDSAKCKN
jgi:hypothetical protein